MVLREKCAPKRRVRSEASPARGSIASTMASITMLRRNTISNVPMWRSSSRAAIAIAVNDRTAPPIHSAPRSAGLPFIRVSYGNEKEPGAPSRYLSPHLPARLLRAHEGDRAGQSRPRRRAQALDAHPGALGPGQAHQDDEEVAGLPAG